MKLFNEVRCVVFDLDDTLWPCEPTILRAEQALYQWLTENFQKITDSYSLEEMRNHRMHFAKNNTHLSHDVTALRHGALAELAKEFSYPQEIVQEIADQGLALFRKHRNQVEFFTDALPTLTHLGEHYEIGAITNGNADLEEIGVKMHFNFVVTAQEAGVAKPDKEIFEYARKKTNLDSYQLLYVGDHPVIDIEGSSNSGWKSLWFNPDNKPWPKEIVRKKTKPDAQIQKLSQLPTMLQI